MDDYQFSVLLLDFAKGFVLFSGFSISFFLLFFGFRILTNGHTWESNREAVSSYNNGCCLTSMPYDYRSRVNPGLMINTKTNTWVAVGSVSDEGILEVLA